MIKQLAQSMTLKRSESAHKCSYFTQNEQQKLRYSLLQPVATCFLFSSVSLEEEREIKTWRKVCKRKGRSLHGTMLVHERASMGLLAALWGGVNEKIQKVFWEISLLQALLFKGASDKNPKSSMCTGFSSNFLSATLPKTSKCYP